MVNLEVYIIHYLFGRVMRVMAMRLKMEIIDFIKMFYPYDGRAFSSVSTYMKTNISVCPWSNPQGVRVRFCPYCPKHTSDLTEWQL